MLVAISYATAINTTTNNEKKESPLYRIRTRRAITEKIGNIIEKVKTKFLGDRIFFVPLQLLKEHMHEYIPLYTGGGDKECAYTTGEYCTTGVSCTWDSDCTIFCKITFGGPLCG